MIAAKEINYNEIGSPYAKLIYETLTIEKASNDNDVKNTQKKSAPKILLVEDNPMIQKINFKILASAHLRVDIANNYEETITNYHKNNYDLILLDIGLPGKSGIDICKKIRQHEKHNGKHIPIIALTAYGKYAKEDCYAAGVDDFAVKPLLNDDLIMRVYSWLPKKFFS